MTQLSIPSIPFDLVPTVMPDDWNERVGVLWDDVLAELRNPDFNIESHYKRHTYDSGCKGPICMKFVRDASRSRPRSTRRYTPREDRCYDPVIDFFRIVATLKLAEENRG